MGSSCGVPTIQLTDEEREKVREFLNQDPKAQVGTEAECRRFVEVVMWLSCSGAYN